MRFIIGENEVVAAYVAAQTGDAYHDVPYSIGVLSADLAMIGGFLFTNPTGFAVEMTLAGRGCITRSAWRFVAVYVFRKLGCCRIQITTRRSNSLVKRMAPRLGFRFEGIARRFYGTEDGVVSAMTRDDAVQLGYLLETA